MIPLKDLNPTRTLGYLTIALITLNVVVFVWQLTQGGIEGELVFQRHGMIPKCFLSQGDTEKHEQALRESLKPVAARWLRGDRAFMARVLQRVREEEDGFRPGPEWGDTILESAVDILREDVGQRHELFTLLTSIFMHGGLLHLLGNMWFLWIFGNNIEDACGRIRYLVFYMLCGLLATAAHILSAPDSTVPTIGASGAISGVLGAYLFLYPRARILSLIPLGFFYWAEEMPAWVFLGVWALIQWVSGLSTLRSQATTGTAWFAHIGGFCAGLLLIYVFRRRRQRAPAMMDYDLDPVEWE
ncbi:MAG: rhomboid family intramembrane serine protease [Verrucomicrobia bacterium]|nr:rhomboid family intramembrane serine protease [Verrucomicrobiota bacterium]